MRAVHVARGILAGALCAIGVSAATASAAELATRAPRWIDVRLDGASAAAVSGRLLVFAILAADAEAEAKGTTITDVDTSPFKPTQVSVAAVEVAHLAPGGTVAINTDAVAFPAGFSHLADGDYLVQAVLDVNRDYNYGGRGAGDLVSDVVPMRFTGGKALPTLRLTRALPAGGDPWILPEQAPDTLRQGAIAAKANTTEINFESRTRSAFSGRPTHLRGWVLVPPGYGAHRGQRYPTVYVTHGFGGNQRNLVGSVIAADLRMRSGGAPEMIYVFLDESLATGTHEFANSVNNGPWGTALTTELLPMLEREYRMDARPSGRLLTGHLSGGWATLWLQVAYPKIFGGTWSTSPDPSDFHDFTGADIYAANANVYRNADGTARPLVRDKGKVVATLEQFARLERVIGPYGGQMASFDWVFSPRGVDGRPLPMFDRDTGDVDPAVAGYWRDHYDIAHILQRDWARLAPDLDGRIHVIVGDADTFYLDGAARRLKAVLVGLGAKADVRFLPGRTHFDLYADGDDRQALATTIAREMYAVARLGEATPVTGASQLPLARGAASPAESIAERDAGKPAAGSNAPGQIPASR